MITVIMILWFSLFLISIECNISNGFLIVLFYIMDETVDEIIDEAINCLIPLIAQFLEKRKTLEKTKNIGETLNIETGTVWCI